MSAAKSGIAKRLEEVQGPRGTNSLAEKMGISRRRVQQMKAGRVPDAWIYLVRLAEDGVDISYLLLGNGK